MNYYDSGFKKGFEAGLTKEAVGIPTGFLKGFGRTLKGWGTSGKAALTGMKNEGIMPWWKAHPLHARRIKDVATAAGLTGLGTGYLMSGGGPQGQARPEIYNNPQMQMLMAQMMKQIRPQQPRQPTVTAYSGPIKHTPYYIGMS